jgi:hypothetical protein
MFGRIATRPPARWIIYFTLNNPVKKKRYRVMRSPSKGISFISRNDAPIEIACDKENIYGIR